MAPLEAGFSVSSLVSRKTSKCLKCYQTEQSIFLLSPPASKAHIRASRWTPVQKLFRGYHLPKYLSINVGGSKKSVSRGKDSAQARLFGDGACLSLWFAGEDGRVRCLESITKAMGMRLGQLRKLLEAGTMKHLNPKQDTGKILHKKQ